MGIALLVQPPIVGAVAFSVGQAFKSYYRVILTEGRCLGPEEMGRLAEIAMRGQLSGGILKKAAGIP